MSKRKNKNIIARKDFKFFIDHPGSVSGLCVTMNGEVILINTRRYNKKNHLELPGGIIDVGESPLEALIREIYEETGFKLSSYMQIGKYYTSGGITNEVVHLFYCLVKEAEVKISTEFEIVRLNTVEFKNIHQEEVEDFRLVIAKHFLSDIPASYKLIKVG